MPMRGARRLWNRIMKYHLVALTLLASLGVAAQSQVQKSMLDTFVKYASIDSQLNYDSICTQGQHNMALEEAYRLMLEIIKQVLTLK